LRPNSLSLSFFLSFFVSLPFSLSFSSFISLRFSLSLSFRRLASYLLTVLRRIKRPDLEEALLLLPFHLVEALVRRLANLLGQRGLDHELVARCKSSFVRSFVCSFS
jgi:hypothetical protein